MDKTDSRFVFNQEPGQPVVKLNWINSVSMVAVPKQDDTATEVQEGVSPEKLYNETVTESSTFEFEENEDEQFSFCKQNNENMAPKNKKSKTVREETKKITENGQQQNGQPANGGGGDMIARAIDYVKNIDKQRWKEYAAVAGITLVLRKIFN